MSGIGNVGAPGVSGPGRAEPDDAAPPLTDPSTHDHAAAAQERPGIGGSRELQAAGLRAQVEAVLDTGTTDAAREQLLALVGDYVATEGGRAGMIAAQVELNESTPPRIQIAGLGRNLGDVTLEDANQRWGTKDTNAESSFETRVEDGSLIMREVHDLSDEDGSRRRIDVDTRLTLDGDTLTISRTTTTHKASSADEELQHSSTLEESEQLRKANS